MIRAAGMNSLSPEYYFQAKVCAAMKNFFLTILAVLLLFGLALAVPGGKVLSTPSDYSETETVDSGEFDFL